MKPAELWKSGTRQQWEEHLSAARYEYYFQHSLCSPVSFALLSHAKAIANVGRANLQELDVFVQALPAAVRAVRCFSTFSQCSN
jgi:hypothetical protein